MEHAIEIFQEPKVNLLIASSVQPTISKSLHLGSWNQQMFDIFAIKRTSKKSATNIHSID